MTESQINHEINNDWNFALLWYPENWASWYYLLFLSQNSPLSKIRASGEMVPLIQPPPLKNIIDPRPVKEPWLHPQLKVLKCEMCS